MNPTTPTNTKTEALLDRIDAADAIVQQAIDRLECAHNDVATAAQCLTQIPGIRVKEGVVVYLDGWKALQDALGEWRSASQGLLDASTRASAPRDEHVVRTVVPQPVAQVTKPRMP